MKSFSVYLLVVISGLLFISSTPISEVKHNKRPIKISISEKRSIEEKVRAGLNAERSPIATVALTPNTSEISNNLEIMPKKNKVVVEEYRQATLSEAAQTFNRKCLELEALIKER